MIGYAAAPYANYKVRANRQSRLSSKACGDHERGQPGTAVAVAAQRKRETNLPTYLKIPTA
jgi:hypothetical protein